MNTPTRDLLALVREYLGDFIASIGPAWLANCCLVSHWADGALDQALQALQAGDMPRALAMLAEAGEYAAQPVPTDEDHAMQAQEERARMALVVSVACALLERAGLACQSPTSASPDPLAMLRCADTVQVRDTDTPLPDGLSFDLPDLSTIEVLPAGAGAAAVALVQGGAA